MGKGVAAAEEIGRRLHRARIAAGLSQEQVADALGIPRPAVSLMESGRRSVSSVELAELSRLYGKPASSFLFEEREEEPLLQRFRTAAPLEDTDLAVLEEAAEWCRYYGFLEEVTFGYRRSEVPVYPVPPGRAIDQGAHVAEQERRRLRLGIEPVRSMIDLLEGQGVKVQLRRFAETSEVSGCFLSSPTTGLCVVINEREKAPRRRFTAAHEYAHCLIDSRAGGEVCHLKRREELVEMRANAFAASFLLPAGGIRGFFEDFGVRPGEVEPEHVVHLMHHFGVSRAAVVWRLLNLGWIKSSEREDLERFNLSRIERVLGYSGEPGADEPQPNRFRAVAIEAWRAGEISLGKLAELLGRPKRELAAALPPATKKKRRPERAPAAEPDWL